MEVNVDEVAVGFAGLAIVASLPLPFESKAALARVWLTDFPVTSPSASRLRLFCAEASAKAEAFKDMAGAAFELDEGGFVLVVIREGRAFAFSLSLAVVRVPRVTRRVWKKSR